MPEENRVFDVAKPGHSSPSATSKPVIVGHQPTMSDPMVNEDHGPANDFSETAPTKINIKDENHEPEGHSFLVNKTETEKPLGTETDSGSPWITPPAFGSAAVPAELEASPSITEQEPPVAEPPSEAPAPAFGDNPSSETPNSETAPVDDVPIEPIGHVEGLHASEPGSSRHLGLISLIILVLLVGAYLAIDSGLIKTGFSLPFHIFKQKPAPTVAAPAASQTQSQATAPVLPTGFTEYKLAGTTITFAAPASWGAPTSSTDDGFTARGTGKKSDGTYAYLVDFATNKSVQIAVTSSKYLPPARGALYYDYLGWCNGTNDGKYYFGSLRFTTSTDKIDTPTTVTCDQGPLTDVTKLDSTTIAQLKAKDGSGNVMGDIYIKNLADTNLPVFRVRDTAMTSGADIKQLLSTVKIPKP